MKNTLLCFLVLTILSCATTKMKKETTKLIDVQGHRGCRGLLPENTIIAFQKALELGVTTLEMDLVISKDKQVVVSHEPFFNHEISTAPDQKVITEENHLEHNIYNLSYKEIKSYDVGLKTHSRFPDQANQKAIKPLLSEVIQFAERLSKELGRPAPYYNVEIKRKPEADNLYHPDAEEFAGLVIKTIQDSGAKDRIYIQSFDVESLQVAKRIDPEIKLVLLIENSNSAEINISKLGFTPEVYSPYHKLVSAKLVDYCTEQDMKLIPWTVNTVEDMDAMLIIGVDGIITDYPDRLLMRINQQAKYSVLR